MRSESPPHRARHIGREKAGQNRVGGDAAAAPFFGHPARQLQDAAFRCAVGGVAQTSAPRLQRADIDNRPGALVAHAAGRIDDSAREKKRRAQIEIESAPPIVGGDLRGGLAQVDSGGVDEDVGRPKKARGGGDDAVDFFFLREVGGERGGLVVGGGIANGGLRGFLNFRLAPPDDDDRSAGAKQRQSDLPPDAGAAAGDKRNPPAQRKKRIDISAHHRRL